MPWKTNKVVEQRWELVKLVLAGRIPVKELCLRHKVSRQTAYKWRNRYQQLGMRGLEDRSCKPLYSPAKISDLWLRRIGQSRRRHPTWGAQKLLFTLRKVHGSKGAPGIATINRWLKKRGAIRSPRRRRLRGPVIVRKPLHVPQGCHEVWTVDFKGWFRTQDGAKAIPLTVRDLHSRYVLGLELVADHSVEQARKVFERLFKRYGVPKRIRSDNGTPFGGGGPTGLTRLSAWWVKLGIEVEFITPGRPCENGAHEQFHRVYKAEVARKGAADQKKLKATNSRWVREYNEERPHEGLGMRPPAKVFRKNRRKMPKGIKPWSYPEGWERRWVKGSGEINWNGSRRFVGEAFVRDYVGLLKIREGVWQVYFGKLLIGEMRENEQGSIRFAKYQAAGVTLV